MKDERFDIAVLEDFDLYSEASNKLGHILLKKNIISKDILVKALSIKKHESLKISETGVSSRNLGQILVQDFNCDHDTIYEEVAKLYAFKTLTIEIDENTESKLKVVKKLINSFGDLLRNEILQNQVLPLKYDEQSKDKLLLAAVDPTNKEIARIAYSLKAKSFEVVYLPLSKYQKLIELLFPPENEYLKNLEDTYDEYQEQDDYEEGSIDENLLQVEINKSALINLFEGALVEGVRRGASDVHIIPVGNKVTNICFRIDGNLSLWHKQENTLPEAILAVVKDRSRGLDRFEREKGQDGFIQREIDRHLIRFRVSILPIAGSEIFNKYESVVIRILDDRKVITDLDKLGLVGYSRTAFEESINKPQGMVILTGPTGSGKSTTIIAALHQVIDPSVNVLTVEDPIEYIIKGARQIKLSHKMNFEQALRSILRHDPDIVLVGEIRDKETADIAIKLSNTGHLTFSTLHTNDAPSVISRLYKMGIEPFLLAYSINVIVAQRLIRKLCTCKKRVTGLDESFFKSLKLDPEEWKKYEIYEPVGCSKCANTGYKGRMAIHETLFFTKEISQIVFNAGEKIDEEKIKKTAKKDGMLTLREAGYERIKKGLTSFEEVIANTMDD